MYISISMEAPLSELDLQVLKVISDLGADTNIVNGKVFAEVISGGTIKVNPEPAKPAAKTKPVAKPKPEPKPEPEPEPMAEEPLPEEEVEEEIEEAGDDDMSDEDLIDLAVKKATEMVSTGKASQVREALEAAGASRVRELNSDNVREFFKALS